MQNKLRLEIGSVNLNIEEILEKSKLNKENLYYDEPMAKHTSFKIGGPADKSRQYRRIKRNIRFK